MDSSPMRWSRKLLAAQIRGFLPDPQIASTELRGPAESLLRSNLAVLDWRATPPRPVGIGIALDSIAVLVIRRSR